MEQLKEKKFILEFAMLPEKKRVVEGGPWWHEGDALIVVDYDGVKHP